MNDFELESKLKSVHVPERAEDYWETFPSQVRVSLRRAAAKPVTENFWLPRFAWAGGLTLALVLVCLQLHPLQSVSLAITKQEHQFHKQLAQLDAGLHVLMFNPHGMSYLLAEAN